MVLLELRDCHFGRRLGSHRSLNSAVLGQLASLVYLCLVDSLELARNVGLRLLL